jgi:uncharacterized protein
VDGSLILGGVIAAVSALLAGASGFGLGIVATPFLLLSGFSLPFVVTVNLLIALATRASVAWRLRHAIDGRRVGLLVAGALPGLWIGSLVLGAVDEHTLKLCAGLLVAAAALALATANRHPPGPDVPGLGAVAGFLGGLLGTTTSLIGVPPALLLAWRRLATASFFADLSVYFVSTAGIGLVVLAVDGQLDGDGARAFVWWLPGVLVGNLVGTTIGLRLPAAAFHRLTLAVAFVAGVVTAATA